MWYHLFENVTSVISDKYQSGIQDNRERERERERERDKDIVRDHAQYYYTIPVSCQILNHV